MTVAELRLALDAMEHDWSAQDRELLGEFRDQVIFVDAIGEDGFYGGLATPAPAHFDACFGVMLIADSAKERRPPMPHGSPAHQRRKSERLQRKQILEGCLAENLKPERAFFLVRKRIEWLNDKIQFALANGQKTFHYTEEREAMLWMLDKIAELSRKLLAVEPQRKEES